MSTEITDNAERKRYEIRLDGELAGFADYEPAENDILVLTHTEVDPAFEGKGVGGTLARGVLDDLRAQNRTVIPLCPFIKGWIQRHPDYRDVVAP
ncbi:GNAT family N-acetyltransferase [Actinomadura decatromicini]|uniref:N-acetyltransferase n=1 Tax=Actinomadura decatromicini TaxID=2604572 RepID=A0A5D3FKG9_9ACTN|nr:GNAT family N-acetyltransferase [Actinomadura decatromicini]TYK48396.1 N-acetyltransferase [Actinomadura decatromicini]